MRPAYTIISRLLCVAILALPLEAAGEAARKKGAIEKDDREIVENLEMLEMLDLLKEMEVLSNYDTARDADGRSTGKANGKGKREMKEDAQ